jgi:DNA-binding beta-propeller fold protein YncE
VAPQRNILTGFRQRKILVLAILFVVFAANLGLVNAESYDFITQFGSYGTGKGQFNEPRELAVDNAGYIYAIDTMNNRIQKFTTGGSFVDEWDGTLFGPWQFNGPFGIAVDNQGYVYITDPNNNRVQKYASDGSLVTEWGNKGKGNGQFDIACGIAVDNKGYVYVIDLNYRVQKFTGDGVFVAKWGSYGDGKGQFTIPWCIAVDDEGYVYLTDTGTYRVEKFTSDGVYVTEWGGYGSGEGQFKSPVDVAVDREGYVYVTDPGNDRVEKFTNNGTFVTAWGSHGNSTGQFDGPIAVAVDKDGFVYVSDLENDRIQKFAISGSANSYTLLIVPVASVTTILIIIVVILVMLRKHEKTKIEKNIRNAGFTFGKYVFISHVEEDAEVVLKIADMVEQTGYKTWYYERNSDPGISYLLQTKIAVEHSQAVILVISPDSLRSRQITVEVIRGHESGKLFVPILLGVTNAEFHQKQPEWVQAIGSATTLSIPKEGIDAIMPNILQRLNPMSLKKTAEATHSPT